MKVKDNSKHVLSVTVNLLLKEPCKISPYTTIYRIVTVCDICDHQQLRSARAFVQSDQQLSDSMPSKYHDPSQPLSARQRNAIEMAFRWRADSSIAIRRRADSSTAIRWRAYSSIAIRWLADSGPLIFSLAGTILSRYVAKQFYFSQNPRMAWLRYNITTSCITALRSHGDGVGHQFLK